MVYVFTSTSFCALHPRDAREMIDHVYGQDVLYILCTDINTCTMFPEFRCIGNSPIPGKPGFIAYHLEA